MQTRNIEATIFYRHSLEEVRALNAAIIPMADHIGAVCRSNQVYRIRMILKGEYFRRHDAAMMRTMLLKAANHARAHLDDYFALMRDSIIADAEYLEEAVRAYWQSFEELHNEIVPTK